MNERLTNLTDSLRGEFRKQQIAYKNMDVDAGKGMAVVVLREEGQRAKAIEAIRTVDNTLAVTGSGDTIQIAYQGAELFKKRKEVVDQSIEILRRRVDETGTIEPTIVRQGDDRILLQVPGIKDTTELKRKINQTAKLTFHLVDEAVAMTGQNIPANMPASTMLVPTREGMQALRASNPKAYEEIQAANPRMTGEQVCRRFQPQCLPVFKRVIVGGEDLDDAKAQAAEIVKEARVKAAQVIDQANRRSNALVDEAKGAASAEALRLPWDTPGARLLGRQQPLANLASHFADESTGWTFDRRGRVTGRPDPCVDRAVVSTADQTASSSTSNSSVAFGGITPPAPRAP